MSGRSTDGLEVGHGSGVRGVEGFLLDYGPA